MKKNLLFIAAAFMFLMQSCSKNQNAIPKSTSADISHSSPFEKLASTAYQTYSITSVSANKAIEIADNSTANGGVVRTGTYADSSQYKWQVSLDPSGYYKVMNAYSGKYLQAYYYAGAYRLIQVQPLTSDDQLWKLGLGGSGSYTLQNKSTGLYMTVPSTANRTMLSLATKLNNSTQWFTAAQLSTQKTITSFSLLKANNSALTADVTGTIKGTHITLTIPEGVSVSALKATFVLSSGASAYVNSVKQSSGVTANAYASSVLYVVTAGDGSTQTYTVSVSPNVPAIATIDNVMTNFMSYYGVPALSLAITQGEKLVYVKSYGMADSENGQAADIHDLYRLASLSKQLTSITIMKLMDQGKININSTVFGTNGILGNTYGTKPYGTNIANITVSQLLHHTSGGWPNDGTDPMFLNPTMTADQLITWTLDNRPLLYVPGTTYAYSNFGYCILGRVIEKITGMKYDDAVRSLVLKPIGITDMVISGNTLAQRLPNEVKYYGQYGEDPYAYNITRMDSHGGWLATAQDLARLICYVDGFTYRKDILTANAETVMTTPSTANANYACGWSVNQYGNWWHQGSLPGTATEQARASNGYNWVILLNTRSLLSSFSGDLDNLFWNSLAATPTWPTTDLFQ